VRCRREQALRERDRLQDRVRLPDYPVGATMAREIDRKIRCGRMEDGLRDCLKRRRQRAGLTQEEAADRIGTTRQTLRGWEQGRNWPNAYWMPLIAATYNCSIEELYLTPEEARK